MAYLFIQSVCNINVSIQYETNAGSVFNHIINIQIFSRYDSDSCMNWKNISPDTVINIHTTSTRSKGTSSSIFLMFLQVIPILQSIILRSQFTNLTTNILNRIILGPGEVFVSFLSVKAALLHWIFIKKRILCNTKYWLNLLSSDFQIKVSHTGSIHLTVHHRVIVSGGPCDAVRPLVWVFDETLRHC